MMRSWGRMLVLLLPLLAVWMIWHRDRQAAARSAPMSAAAMHQQMHEILAIEHEQIGSLRGSTRKPMRSAKYSIRSGAPGIPKPGIPDFTLDASPIYDNINPDVYIESGPSPYPDLWLLFDLGAHGSFTGFTVAGISQLQLLGHPNAYFQYSDDGVTFSNASATSCIARMQGNPSSGTMTVICSPLLHRYIRIQMQASSATSPVTDYQRLFDIVVYDAKGSPIPGPSVHRSPQVALKSP